MSSFFFQLLYFALGCYLVCTVSAGVDKEIILKEPTKGERWHWQSDAAWRSTDSKYFKCTICSTSLWSLRTPFLKLPPLVRTIDVTIAYKVVNCSTINTNGCSGGCSEEFDLKKLEANEPMKNENLRHEFFNDTVKTIRSPNPGNKITDVTTVTINSAGVYFALLDKNACQTLYSFEVSYKICSKAGANLLVFENTPIPATGKYSNTTGGRCVKNSVLAGNGTTPRAVCDGNGNWIVDSNATCFCNPGYQPSADFKLCVECPQGTFKGGVGNEPCRNCSSKLVPDTNRTGCIERRTNATIVEPSGSLTTVTPSPFTPSPSLSMSYSVNQSMVPSTKPVSSTTPVATTSMSTATVGRPLLEMIVGLLLFILVTPSLFHFVN